MTPELFLLLFENQQASAKEVMAIPAIRAEIIPPVPSNGDESKSGTIIWGISIRIIPVIPSRMAVRKRNAFIFLKEWTNRHHFCQRSNKLPVIYFLITNLLKIIISG